MLYKKKMLKNDKKRVKAWIILQKIFSLAACLLADLTLSLKKLNAATMYTRSLQKKV